MNLKKLKNKLTKSPKEKEKKWLSTGCTILNCQISGNPFGGWLLGRYHLLVGDSSSGKTALSLTCLAEATLDPFFDDYELIHDDVEYGSQFSIRKLFGKKLEERLKVLHSVTVEELYFNIDKQMETGKPFIYIVDSSDGLMTEADETKFQKRKKSHEKKKRGEAAEKEAGSYAMSKPKYHSENLRRLSSRLAKSNSLVIMICQTRDNIGYSSMFDPKTHSGGRALKFFATTQVWSSIKKRLYKEVRKRKKMIGIISKVSVKKNRATGEEGSIEVPIYYSLGFDDIGSSIDFLVEWNHWKKAGGKIKAAEFDLVLSKESLIHHIEKNGLRRKLQKIVGKVWKEVESETAIKRENKYA